MDPRTGKHHTAYETRWTTVHLGISYDRTYSPEDATVCQLYGAHKYPRSHAQAMAPGPAVNRSEPFKSSVLEVSDGSGDTRRVGPFEIHPDEALRLALSNIRSAEYRSADAHIKELTG